MAASNSANGRTVAAPPTIGTSVTATPKAVTNLRWVASGTDSNGDLRDPELRLYWTLPINYPDAPTPAQVIESVDPRNNWSIQVARYNSADNTWPVVSVGTIDTPAQWQSGSGQVEELLTAQQQFSVRYINNAGTPGSTDEQTADDAPGLEVRFHVPQLTAEEFASDVLPQIDESPDGDNGPNGLRFAYNQIHPDVWLDLMWDADENANAAPPNDVPTGYAIDFTEDATVTKNTVWRPVPNQPGDLGATRQYTHKGVIPGKQYRYRVFPEFGGNFGIPAEEQASSREADLPDPVRGLTVEPNPDNPQTSLVLDWPMVTEDGGHEILHYLVQIARGDFDNNTTLGATPTWRRRHRHDG